MNICRFEGASYFALLVGKRFHSRRACTITNHIYSGNKHRKSKAKLVEKQARERDIASYFKKVDKTEPIAGSMVLMEERVYRIRVVEAFLSAGIPLAKVDCLRGLLEENGLRLTSSTHLYDYIPPLLKQEKENLRAEIEGNSVSAIFDGTTRFGEALAICFRFVKDGKVQQRLVRLLLLEKPLTGDELAREFLTVLCTELGVVCENLLACMRDGASVNGKAMRTIEIMYPKVMNITCFSHALDIVGSKFVIPNLDKFTKHWFQIIQRSSKAKLLWRERTGQSLKS